MKLSLKIIIFLISINGYCQELQEIKNFGSNPGNLRMFYFNPNPDNSIKKPVVIALHGCGQSAENFNKITDWTKLATEENFILIFPQQKTSNNIKTVGRLLLPTENQVHILNMMLLL